MTSVPFLDVSATHADIADDLVDAARRVIESGWYILGEEVSGFEHSYAAFAQASHCVSVGNGLDALRLALWAADVGPGDEVIVPAFTFIATWLAVTTLGATVVPVDVRFDTACIDPTLVRSAVTERTKAIVPVHLYGGVADLTLLRRMSDVPLVIDAAQAHGATAAGHSLGGDGVACAWSFYPGKNLGALGDGGAITTNDDGIAERLRLLRNFGSHRKYEHLVVGVNTRLDEIQAALLRVKLTHLPRWVDRRRAIASAYSVGLADAGIGLPHTDPNTESSWHLYVVKHEARDELAKRLRDRGVETLVHYPVACHLQPAYGNLGFRRGDFPVAERLAETVLSLPMGPHLDDEQVEVVIASVRELS